MILNKNLVLFSIIAYFLLVLYAVYFRFFPIIISPEISNCLLIGLLILLLGILIIQPFQLKTSVEFYLILPQYLIFAFITRALPTLRFTYQPLSDPYYYFISTLNIADYGTLQPVLSWWYGLTQQQLTWPNLHLIGSSLMNLTGIHSIEILRYLLPAMGVIFFLGVFLLIKEITSNNTVAILAGLIASTSDSVLFYQSEYHPQGLALVYFIFLLALVIRYFSTPSMLNGFLMIVYALVFSLSHHFSSVFFGLLSVFILLSFWLYQHYFSRYFKFNNSKHFNFFLLPWIIIAFLMLFSHIFNYPAFLKVVHEMMRYQFEPTGALFTYGSTIPLQVTILNSTKYLLLALAIISILYIYKSKNKKEFFCFIIFIGILISGVIGTFIAFIPVDRLIGFYIPFAALFAALTLYRFHNDWLTNWNVKVKKLLILFISLIILLAGPLNFFAPGLIFHDTPEDSYYWHSNDFSGFSSYGVPGEWIKGHISQKTSFYSHNNTVMIPYFYGQIPATVKSSDEKPAAGTDYLIYNIELMKQKNPQKSGSGIVAANQVYTIGKYGIGINV